MVATYDRALEMSREEARTRVARRVIPLGYGERDPTRPMLRRRMTRRGFAVSYFRHPFNAYVCELNCSVERRGDAGCRVVGELGPLRPAVWATGCYTALAGLLLVWATYLTWRAGNGFAVVVVGVLAVAFVAGPWIAKRTGYRASLRAEDGEEIVRRLDAILLGESGDA